MYTGPVGKASCPPIRGSQESVSVCMCVCAHACVSLLCEHHVGVEVCECRRQSVGMSVVWWEM
jgi:hypothetical protein